MPRLGSRLQHVVDCDREERDGHARVHAVTVVHVDCYSEHQTTDGTGRVVYIILTFASHAVQP